MSETNAAKDRKTESEKGNKKPTVVVRHSHPLIMDMNAKLILGFQ